MPLRLLRYLSPLFFLLLFSCKKTKLKIEEPAYLYIPYYDVHYSSTYANGGPGTTSHKFTDVDVSVNGTNIGVFPVPATIPIQESGANRISIKPVIKVNGVSTVRSDYAPIKLIDTVLNLAGGQKTTFIPDFDYYPSGVTFYWVEDFEFAGSSLVGDTAIKLQSEEKFEGNRAVKIELRNGQTICTAQSSSLLPLPTSSQMLYLEVNYKCNHKFTVGLVNSSYTDVREVGGANASEEWNKIYFFLTPAASGLPTYPSYFVYFNFSSSGYTGSDTPKLYIDNIKVVSQP